jgi:hypothetical protein
MGKRLELLKRRLKAAENEEVIQVPFSAEVVTGIANGWFRQLVEQVRSQLVGFEELFLEVSAKVWAHKTVAKTDSLAKTLIPESLILGEADLFRNPADTSKSNMHVQVFAEFNFDNLKTPGKVPIYIWHRIQLEFFEIKYTLKYSTFDSLSESPFQKGKTIERLLHQGVTESEQVKIAEEIAQAVLDEIEYRLAH